MEKQSMREFRYKHLRKVSSENRKRPWDYMIQEGTFGFRLVRGADMLVIMQTKLEIIEQYLNRLPGKIIIKRQKTRTISNPDRII